MHALGGELERSTRDVDFWSSVKNDAAFVQQVILECLQVKVPEDGIVFDEESLEMRHNQFDSRDRGIHLELFAYMGTARVKIKMDIAFGSPIIPDPVWIIYPELLDFGAPCLLGYPKESIVADKFEAMVSRDKTNSRLKDFYDIWVLSEVAEFDGTLLLQAIQTTFKFYDTSIPTTEPLCLTAEFFNDPDKERKWNIFLKQAHIHIELPFSAVVQHIREFLTPVYKQVAEKQEFKSKWIPKIGWSSP